MIVQLIDIRECQFEAILSAAKEIFEGIDYQELERLVDLEQLMAVSNYSRNQA